MKYNERILEKFNYGKSLFPDDLLDKVTDLILNQKTLSANLVQKVLLDHNCNPDLIEEAIEEYNKRFMKLLSGIIKKIV